MKAGLDFYVSTTAFRRKPLEAVLEIARQAGLALEFSSGMPYRSDMKELFLACDVKRLPHNYFPAPSEPFVLNLGSSNAAIRRKSVEHCRQGLELAHRARSGFFSVHAGFCIDPAPSDLGRQFKLTAGFDHDENWGFFLESVRTLAAEAGRLGVDLLIENNVLAPFNLPPSGQNPLLCVTAEECLRLMKEAPHSNLGLLLDTAHLKVSSGTLKFELEAAVRAIAPHVRALHHSDNDGLKDDNRPLQPGYWFLKLMPLVAGAAHILEVHDQSVEDIERQQALLAEALKAG